MHCLTEGLVSDLADGVVRQVGWNALIFPTIPLGHGGANGIGGMDVFPGTYTVRATTLRAVFMDLASELGEQGFRWILIVTVHFPPNDHNRALHQAGAYFHDVYGGKMVHLLGHLDFSILNGVLTDDDQEVAGIDVHAGALESSWMLHRCPDLVDPAYKQARPQSGKTWEDLRSIASAPDWPGYLGAPALANSAYGAAIAEKFSTVVVDLALRVLDGEDVDASARHDGTLLQDNGWSNRKQAEWLEEKGLAPAITKMERIWQVTFFKRRLWYGLGMATSE